MHCSIDMSPALYRPDIVMWIAKVVYGMKDCLFRLS